MQLSAALPLALVLFARQARGLANVTIDDQSPLISYAPAGSWARINDSSTATLDIDGGHMLTSDPTATAVLNFTGVAVYFYSARWPYNVSSAVVLDGGPAMLLDLTDHTHAVTDGGPATVKAAVVGAAVGLKNITHTLTVSVGAGQPFAVVDAIMYTALGPHDSLPASSTNSTPPTQLTPVPLASTTSSTAHKSHTSRALAIALPIVFILLLILLLILLFLWRRQRASSYTTTTTTAAYPFPGAEHSPLGGARTMRNAYATDEMGEEEKAGLRITNPDPAASPASLVGPAPPVIAMPTPSARASAVPPRHNAGADEGSDGDKQSALRSPGTYYNTLRAMTHSPNRAYPVQPPPAHQPWDSADADADMYGEDSRPASRSVYSQVTAIGLEEGEPGGGGVGVGAGVGAGGRSSAVHGAGRHRASGRASGYTYTEANSSAARGGGGGGRAGYEGSLAYVPVFKK